MKKMVRQFVYGFTQMMMIFAANAQTVTNNKQEEKIRLLISQ